MTGPQPSARILFGVRGDPRDGGWCEAAHRAAAAVRATNGASIEIVDALPERLDAEWTAVVGHGIDFAAAIERSARANPQVDFLLTDDVAGVALPPNLCRIDWRWDEGAFLAGVLASYLTKSGRVGVLGGDPCRTQHLTQAAFVRGARYDRDDLTVLTAQAGSFDDPERGFRLAGALFDEGADVLLHTADSTGRGAIRAAQARSRTMIGFLNRDDREQDGVAAVISTDVEGVATSLLDALARGQRPSGVVPAGLASGRQKFELIGAIPERARRRIEELAAWIAAGDLAVRELAET